MAKQAFISVGSRADLGALFLMARLEQDVDWTVPKEARVGDRLYLIVPSRSGPVQAYGTVVDLPYKTADFGGRYRATVADLKILDVPVRLDDLRERFPHWPYLENPKSYYKIPKEYLSLFEEFVAVYQDVPDWKALIALESREQVLAEALSQESNEDATESVISGDFEEDEEEAEERVFVSIKRRRGQADFRALLLLAYNRTCAITGYNWHDALEAAHILPYRNRASNEISNGLLLRADIHTLFDLNLIGIDRDGKVLLSPLLQNSSYGYMNGKLAYLPKRQEHQPNLVALNSRLHSLR